MKILYSAFVGNWSFESDFDFSDFGAIDPDFYFFILNIYIYIDKIL